jgi:hypothetical protein
VCILYGKEQRWRSGFLRCAPRPVSRNKAGKFARSQLRRFSTAPFVRRNSDCTAFVNQLIWGRLQGTKKCSAAGSCFFCAQPSGGKHTAVSLYGSGSTPEREREHFRVCYYYLLRSPLCVCLLARAIARRLITLQSVCVNCCVEAIHSRAQRFVGVNDQSAPPPLGTLYSC